MATAVDHIAKWSSTMDKRVGQIVLECVLDLGITVVYATFVGLIIVAVVASDDGPISLWTAALYASLLPAAVTALIAFDLLMRVVAERRALRRRADGPRNQRAVVGFDRKSCLSDA